VDREFGETVDPATWRKLTLRAPKADGTVAEITYLRPLWWLKQEEAEVGGTVDIYVPECSIDGEAEVLAIDPCPPIAPGRGAIVTGTFRHHRARVIDLYLEGDSEPIGTTPNHLFWSEDRKSFVRADLLEPGERLQGLSGDTRVAKVVPRLEPETVYNLEVQGEHVYHVSRAGVLVHNSGVNPARTVGISACPKGGVYVLRDKKTGKAMYVGRTNDLARRQAEWARDPIKGKLDFDPVYKTNNKAARRGLEQSVYEKALEENPNLQNRIRPIDPNNNKFEKYMNAAQRFLDDLEGGQ
jgi:hypothetical protein